MNTKNILSVVVGLFSALSITSCTIDIPVSGGHGPQGPVYHQGGGPNYGPTPGHRGRQQMPPYGHGNNYGGMPQYGGHPNSGPTVYHGDQRRHVYGNGPQSYAQWGESSTIYYGDR